MRVCIIFFCLLVHEIGSAQILKGQILHNKNREPFSSAALTLQSKDGKREVRAADTDGNFFFSKIDTSKVYSITVSSVGYRDTTFKNISVKGDTTITLVYAHYCQYDASIKNKTCPVCKRKDAVIPIVYGYPVTTHGEDPMKNNGKKYILAGCEISGCDPHWYCKRDKTSF